jgi:hypothetical protein
VSDLQKALPRGDWFFIPNLPLNTTDESLSAWLAERGVDIPADHISLKEYPHCKSAIVCVPKQTILNLFQWAIGSDLLESVAVLPEMMKSLRPL